MVKNCCYYTKFEVSLFGFRDDAWWICGSVCVEWFRKVSCMCWREFK